MKPWIVLAREELLDRRPWLRVAAEHVRLPNGHEIPDFYTIEMPEWVQVFAVDGEGQVAMIEHYKHGAGMTSMELPAGYIDPGETPEETGRRELLEETGLEASEWRYLGRYFIDGNRGCGASHVFLARDVRRVAAPTLEASEIIAQRRLPLDDVRRRWLEGEFRNLGTLGAVGLALAILEREP